MYAMDPIGEKSHCKDNCKYKEMNIYIKHNGCLNLAIDFNTMLTALKKANHVLKTESKDADVIIFAGCGVRSEWVTNAIKRINSLDTNQKEVVISGCIANIETERIKEMVNAHKLSFKTIKEIISDYTPFRFEDIYKEFSQNETTNFIGDNPLRDKIGGKRVVLEYIQELDKKYGSFAEQFYKNMTSGFAFYNEEVPVEFIVASRGCPYNCTYCTIPKGRGKYESVKIEHILYKVENAINNNRYKIIIIGDELGNYGVDLRDGTNFKTLLDAIIKKDERITVSLRYIEPIPFMKYYDVIKDYCVSKKISLIHLPIQTGSQRVLKAMNRNYDINKLVELCVPLIEQTDTAFCTNWLVGFPTETEEDFNLTLQVAKRLNFNLNTAIPFSPRPGTIASTLTQINSKETIRNRCSKLEQILLESKFNQLISLTPNISVEEKRILWQLMGDSEDTPVKQL